MEQNSTVTDVHIGRKIAEVLKEKNMLQADLGRLLGIKAPSVSYMLYRDTMDVKQLARVSRLLKHNFLKYYGLEELEKETGDKGQGARDATTALSMGASTLLSTGKGQVKDEKDIRIEGLLGKIAALEKEIDGMKREALVKENEWLRKINSLLEKK